MLATIYMMHEMNVEQEIQVLGKTGQCYICAASKGSLW